MDWEVYDPRSRHDDWETETASYSPDKFYTRSTDSKGHSEVIYVKVHPNVARLMAEIVQQRDIPEYRTTQDLVRDAIVHRLHYLRGRLSEKRATILRQIETMESVLTHEDLLARYEKVMDHASKIVKQLLEDKNPAARQEARRIVRELYGEAAGMTDSPYWRDKYLHRIVTEFGPLLEEGEEE